jgi:hypothetical protein
MNSVLVKNRTTKLKETLLEGPDKCFESTSLLSPTPLTQQRGCHGIETVAIGLINFTNELELADGFVNLLKSSLI